MTIATIDIGTNTVLLLVARLDTSGAITPLVEEQRVPRLGKGVDADKNLQEDSMQRVVAVVREYQHMMSRFTLDAVAVAGTSAARDAHNKERFVEIISRETGLSLEILSGGEEARWTYRGAISGIPGIEKATVVDIGGGSTEITVGNSHTVHQRMSLNIGSVRLTERCFKHDPPTRLELEKATELVHNELAKPKGFEFGGSTLVGVAGTATSLAILDQGLREFLLGAVTNYRLRFENVTSLFRRLEQMPSSEIVKLSSVMKGRHDIITAGALILREIMAYYRFAEVIVSERGVRYGLALREWEKLMSH